VREVTYPGSLTSSRIRSARRRGTLKFGFHALSGSEGYQANFRTFSSLGLDKIHMVAGIGSFLELSSVSGGDLFLRHGECDYPGGRIYVLRFLGLRGR
jgi:hypothetical protein